MIMKYTSIILNTHRKNECLKNFHNHGANFYPLRKYELEGGRWESREETGNAGKKMGV